ncbi:MAG: flippase-like domain-containing protein [Planctomycetaceae bacterium]|nr:flippase-like domain-containing protein [Planctomycetaceae bacterium]
MNRLTGTIRQKLRPAICLMVAVGCLAYSLTGIDFHRLAAAFSEADYRVLPVLLLLLVGCYLLKAWRWSLLLRPVASLKTADVLPAMLTGFMANNVLPAHLGEFVRVFALGRQYGCDRVAVLSTVVVERIFDVAAILLLFVVSLTVAGEPNGDMEKFSGILSVLSVCCVVAAMVAPSAFASRPVRHMIAAFTRRLSANESPFLRKMIGFLSSAVQGAQAVRDPRILLGIGISSFAQWLLIGLMIFCCGRAFNIGLSVYDAMITMGIIMFAILLPSPPGYVGVIQACFRFVLVPRFAAEDVVAASVLYQISQIVPVTIVGLVMMNRIGLSLESLRIAPRPAAAAD